MKTIDFEQLEFKQKVDCYGLLNSGKKAWLETIEKNIRVLRSQLLQL